MPTMVALCQLRAAVSLMLLIGSFRAGQRWVVPLGGHYGAGATVVRCSCSQVHGQQPGADFESIMKLSSEFRASRPDWMSLHVFTHGWSLGLMCCVCNCKDNVLYCHVCAIQIDGLQLKMLSKEPQSSEAALEDGELEDGEIGNSSESALTQHAEVGEEDATAGCTGAEQT